MKLTFAAACVAVALAAAPAAPARAGALPEFQARYDAAWNGMQLGEIAITLSRDVALSGEKGDCYRYQSQAHPVGMVAMLYGDPSEVSRFCVVDGKVQARGFEFVAGRKDSFTLDFDWAAGKLRLNKDGAVSERELPPGAQDRFGMHQVVRLWLRAQAPAVPAAPLEFTMVTDRKTDTYRIEAKGRERVTVPNGEYDAIRVERTDNPRRVARFWLAPEQGYMPVKVETGKDGKVELAMQLKSYAETAAPVVTPAPPQ